MVKINVKVQGSEAIIKKFRDERIVKEPLADMIKEGTQIFYRATQNATAVGTAESTKRKQYSGGTLKDAVGYETYDKFHGWVGLDTPVEYATFNAWGAYDGHMAARHAVGGQTVADGYGFVNYAFNTNIKRIYGIVYKKMLPEIARRLRE